MVGHYFFIYHMIRCSSSVGGWVLKWKLLWSGGCWCYFTTVYVDFLSVIAVELLVNRKGSLLMCFAISLFIYLLKWKLLWSGGCWCYFTTVYVDFLSVIAVELLVNRKGSLLMCFAISLFIYLPPRHILYIHIVTFEATIDKQSQVKKIRCFSSPPASFFAAASFFFTIYYF